MRGSENTAFRSRQDKSDASWSPRRRGMDPTEDVLRVVGVPSDEGGEGEAIETDMATSRENSVDESSNSSAAEKPEAASSPEPDEVFSEANKEFTRKRKAGSPSSWIRCKSCGQLLDGILSCDFADDAVREKLALEDPIFEVEGRAADDRTTLFVKSFSIHDEEGHLVALDAGLIESRKSVYFSGFIMPPFDEEAGKKVKYVGAINGWWLAGIEQGEQLHFMIATELADYYLKCPSDKYADLMTELQEKAELTKIIVEILLEAMDHNSDIAFDSMFERLCTRAKVELEINVEMETLIKHAEFIVRQITSYFHPDNNDDKEDQEKATEILNSSCLRDLRSFTTTHVDRSSRKAAQGESDDDQDDVAEFDDDNDDDVRDVDYIPQRRADGDYRREPRREQQISRVALREERSEATTTPLVRKVFEIAFKNCIKAVDDKASLIDRRCGSCEACMRPDCGQCGDCKSTTKFGGSGNKHAVCVKRTKCLNSNAVPVVDVESQCSSERKRHKEARVQLLGEPLHQSGNKRYYKSANINGHEFRAGDFVTVRPDIDGIGIPYYIGRIIFLCEDGKDRMAHLQYFSRGNETVLGELADPKEIFCLMDCQAALLADIDRKLDVYYWPVPDNWHDIGGTEEAIGVPPENVDGELSFYFRMCYDPATARFESIEHARIFGNQHRARIGNCQVCPVANAPCYKKKPRFYDSGNGQTELEFLGQTFAKGDAVFLSPEAYEMPTQRKKSAVPKNKIKVDEKVKTEYYRYKEYTRGSNDDTPDPFRIGIIDSLRPKTKDATDPTIRVRLMYRPENTTLSESEVLLKDLGLVYYSSEFKRVSVRHVQGLCVVKPQALLPEDTAAWLEQGPNRFYFSQAFNRRAGIFEEVPEDVIKDFSMRDERSQDAEGDFPHVVAPLRTLDVFAGCGGLSLGLEQAGISHSGSDADSAPCHWAIENYPPAAEAYKLNYPKAVVITDDCNKVLEHVMSGHSKYSNGLSLPQKGDVELLCGGPPCQGFSHMNLFTEREYSQFKNSLIVTYLSYCDYYRPKYFVLENVMNFALFKKNLVLKLCLRALVMMGYQCTFGVLQAGNFGVPQTRRRCILMAAAPGFALPSYPEPTHAFSQRSLNLDLKVNGAQFTTNCRWRASAPYRTITVRDAMSDLPAIPSGFQDSLQPYESRPQSHFQRQMRQGLTNLRDHICKKFKPLMETRFKHIPTDPGSDWRDLPNIEVTFSDGERKWRTEKMRYNFNGTGKKSCGVKERIRRGVCPCAEGYPCNQAAYKQELTLIPWSLVHTADRNACWGGLYGRIAWDGFFSTVVTDPEPSGKQGRVLHPDQHRVVSVRECARSQGFPDRYKFAGTISDRHRQIGNAVPPTLGRAIGLEIRKALNNSLPTNYEDVNGNMDIVDVIGVNGGNEETKESEDLCIVGDDIKDLTLE